jgi:hypothetical protein
MRNEKEKQRSKVKGGQGRGKGDEQVLDECSRATARERRPARQSKGPQHPMHLPPHPRRAPAPHTSQITRHPTDKQTDRTQRPGGRVELQFEESTLRIPGHVPVHVHSFLLRLLLLPLPPPLPSTQQYYGACEEERIGLLYTSPPSPRAWVEQSPRLLACAHSTVHRRTRPHAHARTRTPRESDQSGDEASHPASASTFTPSRRRTARCWARHE